MPDGRPRSVFSHGEGRPKLEILLIVAVVAVALVAAYFSHLNAQKRLQELAALGAELGWSFDASSDDSLEDRYPQFDNFSRGHSRYAYNTLTGMIGIDGQACTATMGDYRYRETSGTGKSRKTRTYTFSYCLVDLPYLQLPDLFIRREGIMDSVSRAFGFDDIDFESVEFSKRFHVKSGDKRFACDVLHPQMMEYMLSAEPRQMEIAGDCCLFADGSDWTADEFKQHREFAQQFFDLWPKHLTSTLQLNRPETS